MHVCSSNQKKLYEIGPPDRSSTMQSAPSTLFLLILLLFGIVFFPDNKHDKHRFLISGSNYRVLLFNVRFFLDQEHRTLHRLSIAWQRGAGNPMKRALSHLKMFKVVAWLLVTYIILFPSVLQGFHGPFEAFQITILCRCLPHRVTQSQSTTASTSSGF